MMEQQPAAEVTETERSQVDLTRRAMWQWVGGMVSFVLASAVIGGLLYKVPYVALVPGSARDTEPLLEVEGIESFPSDGELLFTTVRLRQNPDLWEYLWLQMDDDAQVVSEDAILAGRTPEENREFNLELMNDSKSKAVAVALEQLGYDAVSSNGVIIMNVVPDSAADGVLGQGDLLLMIDDQPVQHVDDLLEILQQRSPGDSISVTIERFAGLDASGRLIRDNEAEPAVVEVVLGAKEEDPEAAFLGIGPANNEDINLDFGFEVEIDSGPVGGPSAGLAFTLAVLDQLTPGELTGGAQVAVTGTISSSGSVGTVGGVLQKTAAVRDLGADAFIVPAGLGEEQLDAIRDRAGDDLQIIPVNTLQEALDALAGLGGEVNAIAEYAATNTENETEPTS